MTQNPNTKNATSTLVSGPYQVLYNVATFLPPSSNYHLKRVCRNFADAVERLTEHWVVPFIYSNQKRQETHVGLFFFADLDVKISPKISTPKFEMRSGKSIYKAVNEK